MPTRKRPDGKYMFDYTVKRVDGTSKRIRKYGFRTSKEAKEAEREFIKNYDLFTGATKVIDFDTACNEYLQSNVGRVAQSTLALQKSIINNNILPYLAKKILNDFSIKDVLKWQQELLNDGKTARTINKATIYLKTIYNFAKANYNLQSIPFRSIKKFKEEKKTISFYTKEEFEQFIGGVNDFEYYSLYNFLFYTGARVGEALALTWNDFDIENKTISINKSCSFGEKGKEFSIGPTKNEQSVRTIELTEYVYKTLVELKKYYSLYRTVNDNDFIFGLDKPINYNTLRYKIKNNISKVGLHKITAHDFRHSHATHLLDQGAPVVMISQRLGHKDTTTTLNIYSHLIEETKHKVLDGLDS